MIVWQLTGDQEQGQGDPIWDTMEHLYLQCPGIDGRQGGAHGFEHDVGGWP